MLKRFGLTLLLAIIGGILGISLAIAFIWGWFDSSWEQIEVPPEPIAELILIERDQVWAESESGILYAYNPDESCQSDCWAVAEHIPESIPSDALDHFDVKNTTCSPTLPLFSVEERIEQCHVEMWANKSYVFALQGDGDIYFWQSDVYGEWLVIELFLGLCAGTICFSVPALLFVLLPGILKWFSKKTKK